MTGFTDLDIHKDGVGTYNLNRFRVAFRSQFGPEYLAGLLITGFPGYFNGPAATVTRQEGDKLKFFGNLPLAGHQMPTPHPDWVRVVITNPRHGFTVQTLHRDSLAKDDFIVQGSTMAGGSMFGPAGLAVATGLGLAEATRINRYHFLAGRRGWRIDHASKFGVAGDNQPFNAKGPKADADAIQNDLIFETAAIERSSSVEIDKIKNLMTPQVIDIWTHMLTKFASMPQIEILPPKMWPLEPGWRQQGRVHFTWQEHHSIGALMGSPDFQPVTRLYPLIYMAPGD